MRSKQAFKNLISNVLLQVITAVSGLILPRFYLVAYGSSMNGMVSSITQFMAYLMLVEAGIGAAAIVGLYGPLADQNTISINRVLSAAKKFYMRSGLLYFLLVLLLAAWYPYLIVEQVPVNISRSIIIILSLSNLIDYLILGKYRVLLTADQKGYVITLTQVLGTILNTVISVILIYNGFSIVAVKLIGTFVYILRTVIIIAYINKNYPAVDFYAPPDFSALGQSWSALIHQIAGVILNNTNMVILTLFLGADSLLTISVYTIYQMVANLVANLIGSFTNSLSSGFGELIYRKDGEALKKAYLNYEYLYLIILFFLYTCMGILYIPFIRLYTQGIGDINYVNQPLAVLFTLTGIFTNLRVPGITLIIAAGHYKQTQRRAIQEAAINLALALLLVKSFGMLGVLFGTLCAFIYSTVSVLVYCNRNIITGVLKQSVLRITRNVILVLLLLGIILKTNLIVNSSYIEWIVHAVVIAISVLSVLIVGNSIFEPEQSKEVWDRVKRIVAFKNK